MLPCILALQNSVILSQLKVPSEHKFLKIYGTLRLLRANESAADKKASMT